MVVREMGPPCNMQHFCTLIIGICYDKLFGIQQNCFRTHYYGEAFLPLQLMPSSFFLPHAPSSKYFQFHFPLFVSAQLAAIS